MGGASKKRARVYLYFLPLFLLLLFLLCAAEVVSSFAAFETGRLNLDRSGPSVPITLHSFFFLSFKSTNDRCFKRGYRECRMTARNFRRSDNRRRVNKYLEELVFHFFLILETRLLLPPPPLHRISRCESSKGSHDTPDRDTSRVKAATLGASDWGESRRVR